MHALTRVSRLGTGAPRRHASKYESSNKYLTTCTLCFRRKNSAREPGRDSLRGRVVFPWVFHEEFFRAESRLTREKKGWRSDM